MQIIERIKSKLAKSEMSKVQISADRAEWEELVESLKPKSGPYINIELPEDTPAPKKIDEKE